MMEKVKLFAAKQYVSAQENYIFNEDMLRRVELHAKVGQLHVEHAQHKADAALGNFISLLSNKETEKPKKKTFVPRIVA